jgi:FlaA1/EpsC-like NDP-sugar epimerase
MEKTEKTEKTKKTNNIGNIPLLILLDVISVYVSFYMAQVSSNDWLTVPGPDWISWGIYSSISAVVVVFVFAAIGVYRWLTDNYGLNEAVILGAASFGTAALLYGLMYAFPVTVLVHFRLASSFMAIILFVFMTETTRIVKRTIGLYIRRQRKSRMIRHRTLLIGAGEAAKIFIDDSRCNMKSKSHVIVICDDDPKKIGRTYSGISVVGPISSVAAFIKQYQIDEVIIAIQNLDKEHLREIISYMRDSDVQIRRMPVLSELGSVNERAILNVDINEIIGRPVVQLDNSEITGLLKDECVLVTGAGGSIGSELVRQIYKAHPATLVLFDIYENGVYDIQQEIRRQMQRDNSKMKLVTLIGSTYNEVRVEQVISTYRPNYIYHAAAYKHVPLMEESPVEAVRTNVVGTYNVARLADKYGVKKMLLISTDKAVRPTNAMGATKRFAEMVIQSFARSSKVTKYCAVRFGNVLGSNGSVIPLFTKQIEEGGPVTVTDPNIIRYFMTIPEAVGLILQSSIYAEGGEIFILDMGKPMKIITLAERMIRQAGYTPYTEMPIVISGLRPGEKLYEETLLDPKTQTKTANSKIFIESNSSQEDIEKDIAYISKVFGEKETPNDVKECLKTIVTTYKPEMDD